MGALGQLDSWLEATALAESPEVRFTSCFPWQGKRLFVPPPASIWPPASPRVRLKAAAFVPFQVVERLAAGEAFEEGRWAVDGPSRCLVRAARNGNARGGPFRIRVRNSAAVDRIVKGRTLPHPTASIEFAPDSGLWTMATFSDESARERWREPVTAAFRLLADAGFGGRRSIGWGRAEKPEVVSTSVEEMFPLDEIVKKRPPAEETAPLPFAYIAVGGPRPVEPGAEPDGASKKKDWWLLSLFCPGPSDALEWEAGAYRVIERGGRVEGPRASGEMKRHVRMVAEGGVVRSERSPRGKAPDVRPDGFPHPVLRYGHPVAVEIPEEVSR
jgi:CRISPR/Cas system CSM-associated protein Csm4 (group 5 of RAMP superfamily)